MPTPLGSILGSGRRATFVLTESNAAFAIPAWAQNGKSHMLVSGCAAGGGVQEVLETFYRGGGGGAGAFAHNFPIIIPVGAATLNAAVGAAVPGGTGGATTIDLAGARVLTLNGGTAGSLIDAAGLGGRAFANNSGATAYGTPVSSGFSGGTSALFPPETPTVSNGSSSLYGIAPIRADVAATGSGYGWGASGRSTTGLSAARAGGNGWLQIEFVEGM